MFEFKKNNIIQYTVILRKYQKREPYAKQKINKPKNC